MGIVGVEAAFLHEAKCGSVWEAQTVVAFYDWHYDRTCEALDDFAAHDEARILAPAGHVRPTTDTKPQTWQNLSRKFEGSLAFDELRSHGFDTLRSAALY